jgi:type VI secretion system protein ImpG
MSKATFLRYYQDQLQQLRTLSVDFARANPALAPMLAEPSGDPDVERLLEGVAFLNGLTRQKLDDEFPELLQELANQLFPHYLRPVPAATLVVFEPKAPLTEAVQVPAGSELASLPVDGTRCRFRISHALQVEPLALRGFELVHDAGRAPALRLDFVLQGIDLAQWRQGPMRPIRLFLGAGYAQASNLLMLLMTRVAQVEVAAGSPQQMGERFALGRQALRCAGFDHEMLAYPQHAFSGFRVIQEYFALPEKLLFVELDGFERWSGARAGQQFSVWLTLTDLPQWSPELRDNSFQLNVVPVLNLFEHPGEPIQHEHRTSEYRVRPENEKKGHYQIFSVDRVVGYAQGASEERVYLPFGMAGLPGPTNQASQANQPPSSYSLSRRASAVGRGQDLFLSIATPRHQPLAPETLSISLTCTNHELPESLKLGDISQPTSSSPERLSFRNIRPVTPQLDPPADEHLLWRMISHISLNFLSLADAANLKMMLGLYIFSERQDHGREIANRHRIAGIESLVAEPETRLIGRRMLSGQRLRLGCRSSHFASLGGLYVFGCVIERFLGDYAAINAYTRLELRDIDTGEVFDWPARLGRQCLL